MWMCVLAREFHSALSSEQRSVWAPTRAQLGQTVLKRNWGNHYRPLEKLLLPKEFMCCCGTGTSRRQIHSPRAPAQQTHVHCHELWAQRTISCCQFERLTSTSATNMHRSRDPTGSRDGTIFLSFHIFLSFYNSCEICRRCHLELNLVCGGFLSTDISHRSKKE